MTLRRLDPGRPYKPLDVGEAGVVASVDARGRLVAVVEGHPEHGAVALTATGAFPEEARYDEAAVRRYRRRLGARNAASFGLRAEGRAPTTAWLLDDALPVVSRPGSAQPALATFVPHPEDTGGFRGVLQVLVGSRTPVPLTWRGAAWGAQTRSLWKSREFHKR